ncbi:TIGR04282 family arsenosugar biosynthesis glycosyltransferase [Flagellimonas flava]|uniref:DUF2064 domain-containing protein n=1 Tax=Flagellimonas flava TaxID=570519 RepID=A0A1M5L323_9FLAO|nr:DUF2064 domain-containing protein [Allomuricauda flava]SHG59330.1 hypothetical protein SAMN04488116_1928 [Allomuricauda flava]
MEQNQFKDTAVLIFASSAEVDSHAKKIQAGVPLFQALTAQTIQVVQATGLPYFHFTENEQCGNSFGDRFIHAIQQVFDQGYSKIVAVGNDSPHLGAKQLLQAAAETSKENVVLGPSLDGGFYLLGLHADHFDEHGLGQLPWQTSSLLNKTKTYLKSLNIGVTLLQTFKDIDALADLKRLSDAIRSLGKQWLQLFSGLLQKQASYFGAQQVFLQTHTFNIPFNKGSPSRFA